MTHIQLVQLRSHTSSEVRFWSAWQEHLRNAIDDAAFVGIESANELIGVHLEGFPIRLIEDILAMVAEAGGLQIINQILNIPLAVGHDGEDEFRLRRWGFRCGGVPADSDRLGC